MSATKSEVLSKIRAVLDELSDLEDQAFYLAMHRIRDLAWEGKEIIHALRLTEHEKKLAKLIRPRTAKALDDLRSLGITEESHK